MTRRIVYGISLWVFLGAAACTVAAILLPDWISYTSPTDHDPIRVSYGLHRRCSSLPGSNTCRSFPRYEDCHGEDGYFCSMWRTTGFLMNFSVIMELVCLVAYMVILAGGPRMREGGWKILAGLLVIVGTGQLAAMALVAFLYDHDHRFFVGWELDKSWALCTVSWTVLLLDGVGIVMAALLLPSEGDYELIPEER